MPRIVKPELVATLEGGQGMAGVPAAQPTAEQLVLLDGLFTFLNEDVEGGIDTLLGDSDQCVIRIRRIQGGEVWVRGD